MALHYRKDGQNYRVGIVLNPDGGAGHTIEDQAGNELTQRDNLQFDGLHVSDDSANNTTVVSLTQTVTKQQLDNLGTDVDGIYQVSDEVDTPWGGLMTIKLKLLQTA